MGCKHIINESDENENDANDCKRCSKCGIQCDNCQGCGVLTSLNVLNKNTGVCTGCARDEDEEEEEEEEDEDDEETQEENEKYILNILEMIANNNRPPRPLKRPGHTYPHLNTEEYETGTYFIRKINHIDPVSSKCLVEWYDDCVTWENANDVRGTEAYKKFKHK
jgi:hypothetical protein